MRSFKWFQFLCVLSVTVPNLHAATLATATYDTDSYIFIGTNNEFDPGITVTEDASDGAAEGDNSHFLFAVVKFDDLTGLTTKPNGGGDKFLKLSTRSVPGPTAIAVSTAQRDIESDSDGYPSGFYPGNPAGNEVDRLQWYMDNIKGDDLTLGGYAGGAPHLGTIDVPSMGDYFLDVTTTVDAWIDGSEPNYGLGLWGVTVPGGQGNTFDFISSDGGIGGPELVSAVPEPSGLVLALLGLMPFVVSKRQ